MPLAGGGDVRLGLPVEQRVMVLDAREGGPAAVGGDPHRLVDPLRREVRAADLEHLALVDELVQGAEGLFDGDVGVGAVHLVEVDPVGAETAEAVVDGAGDPLRGPAPGLGVLAHLSGELGRDDGLVPPGAEGLAEELLGRPLPVDVGRVEEGHAPVEGFADHPVGLVGFDPHAEVVAAEPDDRDLEASDPARLHVAPSVAFPPGCCHAPRGLTKLERAEGGSTRADHPARRARLRREAGLSDL